MFDESKTCVARRDSVSAWLPSALWMAFLFYLSSLPQIPGPQEILTIQIVRKTGHAFVYGILAALNYRALHNTKPGVTRPGVLAWVLAVSYAATDEAHQAFVPGRHATAFDVLIDALGAALAVYGLMRWAQRSVPAAQEPG